MGRCYEFHAEVQPGCEQAMVVTAEGGACECPSCGARCTGRFSGCAVVLATPGRVPPSAPVWALPEPGYRAPPAEPGPAAPPGRRRREAGATGAAAAAVTVAAAPGGAGADLAPVTVIDLDDRGPTPPPVEDLAAAVERLGRIHDGLAAAVARLADDPRAPLVEALAQLRAELVRRDLEMAATVGRLLDRDRALATTVSRLAGHQDALSSTVAGLADRHDEMTRAMERFQPQMERIGAAMNRLAITLVQVERYLSGHTSLRRRLGGH